MRTQGLQCGFLTLLTRSTAPDCQELLTGPGAGVFSHSQSHLQQTPAANTFSKHLQQTPAANTCSSCISCLCPHLQTMSNKAFHLQTASWLFIHIMSVPSPADQRMTKQFTVTLLAVFRRGRRRCPWPCAVSTRSACSLHVLSTRPPWRSATAPSPSRVSSLP